MPEYIDTHCHLNMHREQSVHDQIVKARSAGVVAMVNIGTDLPSSRAVVETAEAEPDVFAVVGVHPNEADQATPEVLHAIEQLASNPRVVGLGETGLDNYREGAAPAVQETSLRRHVDLARNLDKTLVVHCRDAWPELLDLFGRLDLPERVVLHCFSGDLDMARRCSTAGWYVSFAGNVTFSNAEPLRVAASGVEDERLLIETDSPFLTPHPHRGGANDPSFVGLTAEVLADVRGTDTQRIGAQTAANARRAFKLPEPAATT